MSANDRSLTTAFGEISGMADKLNLPKSIVVSLIYRQKNKHVPICIHHYYPSSSPPLRIAAKLSLSWSTTRSTSKGGPMTLWQQPACTLPADRTRCHAPSRRSVQCRATQRRKLDAALNSSESPNQSLPFPQSTGKTLWCVYENNPCSLAQVMHLCVYVHLPSLPPSLPAPPPPLTVEVLHEPRLAC